MAKDKLTDYDATASNNTDIGGIDINQGTMIPSNVDNAIREMMSHLKDFAAGTQAVSSIAVSGDSKVFSTTTNNSITTSVNTSSNYAQTITLNDVGLAFDNNSSIRGYAFGNNGSERMRIQSGGGISFNGDTAAVNALDDYEEGSFTPVFTRASSGFSTTPTYSTQDGSYVKIGSLVHAEIEIRFANSFSGGSGNYLVSNLPFNNSGMSNLEGISWGLMTIFNHTWSFSNTYAYLSGTDVHFGSGMGLASNTTSQYLTFTIQYRVA